MQFKKHVTTAVIAIILGLALSSTGRAAEPKLGQETFEYCMSRGQMAMEMATMVLEGTAIDSIKMKWKEPAANIGEQDERDLWIERLREEVAAALAAVPTDAENRAARVGNKIAETCAYNYGRSRTEKKVSFTPSENEDTEWMKRIDKLRVCAAHSRVAVIIFKLAQGGMSQNEFWKAYPLHQDWTQEQKDEAIWITDTAYAWTGTPIALEDKVYFACKAALHLPPLKD